MKIKIHMMKQPIFITIIIIALLQTGVINAQSFSLITADTGAFIHYRGNETVVNTAIDMLIDDSRFVCTTPFTKINEPTDKSIIIGIPNREPWLCELLEHYKLDYKTLANQWEAYRIIDVGNHLFVLGSDPRGTAYGVLEFSRQIGVSPWVWWADVKPQRRNQVSYTGDDAVHAPSVQYRGIFLNDEDWALMPWSTRTYEPTTQVGAIGPETYSRIFELLLRLRANTIWPAMHECSIPFFQVEGNKQAAEKYGIVLSTSHAEPMMRTNTGEWDNNKYGPFNFLTNQKHVLSYWEERVKQLTHTENIYTIGMRGIHDGRMQGVQTLDEETQVLYQVIEEQRDMLRRNNSGKNIVDIPQIFIPYKEVLEAYDNGLKLPDDVTLVWCDDNHGYIMRQSNVQEQKRSGGAGVYYHVSYWGKPHDYLWLGSTQPGLIYAEMKRAWDNGARKLWILNVGDIKPNEYLTEFFLDMAWDINSITGNTVNTHLHNWLKTTFGSKISTDLSRVMQQYYHLAGQRKPEHMGWNQVEDWELRKINPQNRNGLQPVKDSQLSSTAFGDEMQRRIDQYQAIADASSRFAGDISPQLRDAYFQLIQYPVTAAAAINRKILYAQKSRLCATTNPEHAAFYAEEATRAYNEIATLDYTYNKDMASGKWELMMDMKPRDLPVFQQPVIPLLPTGTIPSAQSLPQAKPLSPAAGTPIESDRMIALNAASYINNISLETIESLGHSGKAVRLPAAAKINPRQPHLEYKITTSSSGPVKIKIGTIPMHSLHGNTEMRYAIVIDNQKPQIVSTRAGFLSEKWEENVLRNQSLIQIDGYIDSLGEHSLRMYAIDEELLVDQIMLDFDLKREHYLIPVPYDNNVEPTRAQTGMPPAPDNVNNPILPGYYADPEVMYSHKTGRYYIYPTTDGFQNWNGYYFKAFSSADLKNWKDEGVILNFQKDLTWAEKNAWAPCIIERKMPNGSYKYFYYYSAAKMIGIAVADHPTGPFVDPLGKPLIDYKLEGQQGGQQIDPDVFCDPRTGKYYLYWGCGYLAVVELNDDMISIKQNTARRITPPKYTEGTEVFYRNGIYYFMWSENDTRSEDYRVRYATAQSPDGPLEIPENNLILSKIPEKGIYGTGHNCVIQIPGVDEWYIIYHRFRRPNSINLGWSAGYHREVCMDKLEFNEDGSVKPVTPTL